jgi:hypothetical protein
MVWFVIAMGLFCRDSYRQIFRWLRRFGTSETPGRSTLCVARQSVGVAPLRQLAEEVIQLQARPDTPHAFYAGMRLMAIDGFVLDLPDTPENERAFGRPGGGRSPGATHAGFTSTSPGPRAVAALFKFKTSANLADRAVVKVANERE